MKPVTVLMYHAIVDGAETGADPHYSVSPAVFRHQLQLILQHGGRVSGIRQARQPVIADAHPVCLTFDDGQRSNLAAAEEIARVGGSAEFFVNPSMVGQPGFLDWPALREMAAMGMSIQSHGMHHRYLDQLSPAEVRAELADSKAAIEDAIGQAVVIYAPAGGRMPDDFLSMAHSIGYETVCSSRVGIWRPASRPVPASAPVSQPGSASVSAIPASVGQGGAAGQTGRDAASGQSGQGAAAHGHGTAANGPGAAAHDHGAAGGQAEEVPRLAMLHNTAEARFLAWITQHPAEMLKQQLRYRVLRLSKQLLGNGGHERLRALLLRTPRTDDTPKDD